MLKVLRFLKDLWYKTSSPHTCSQSEHWFHICKCRRVLPVDVCSTLSKRRLCGSEHRRERNLVQWGIFGFGFLGRGRFTWYEFCMRVWELYWRSYVFIVRSVVSDVVVSFRLRSVMISKCGTWMGGRGKQKYQGQTLF